MRKIEKLQHSQWYDDVYLMRHTFILNVNNDKDIENVLKKHYKGTYKLYKDLIKKDGIDAITVNGCGGRLIELNRNRLLIIVKRQEPFNLAFFMMALVHECEHALLTTFTNRGVCVDYTPGANNEAWAYYMGALMLNALENHHD